MSSMTTNKLDKYGWPARWLHWLMALFFVSQTGLGFWMAYQGAYGWYSWHKVLGVVLLMLAIVRFAWRMANVVPHLRWLTVWQRRTAQLTHYLLYVMMLAMPISGMLMSSYADKPVVLWGIAWRLPLTPDQSLAEWFRSIHQFAAYGLVVLLLIHTAAAIKHHFWDGDHVLLRMLGR